ncbi:LytTR family DNA-binding domain-containing protein [Aciduricibacillus chroicocephali]|uniref:LytTR family DNA-binding domain-containing protein n=1 Tax=Aciduricibacillus chroicocephali TaxID=3054939 RepID=A0ABY9KVP2_9BACI|nr:LytTR family DNA-binding domain-containing protein [Bacillaceae bacterium 44XB]
MLNIYLVQKNTDPELIEILEMNDKVKLIDQAPFPKEAFWNINRLEPDAVLVDLDGSPEEGIELAKHLNHLKTPPLLIFASSDDTYAPQAIGLGAVDYIVKPFTKKRLQKSADTLVHYYNQTYSKSNTTEKKSYKRMRARNKYTDKFLIKLKESIIVINTDEIVYIGTENRKVFVKTLEGKYTVDTPLYILERRLGPSFVRIHRSFIVNIYYLIEIQPWFNDTYNLLFKDGSRTPVSRTYVKSFRKTLGF